MNNAIKILALAENDQQRVVFVSDRYEAGFSINYDPMDEKYIYSVFIHRRFPFEEVEFKDFESFAAARSYAASRFKDWQMLSWDMKTKRPCEEGGKECGKGDCETCKELSLSEKASGALPQEHSGCGSCQMA